MATYAELLLAAEDETLNKKVRVACIIAADTVRSELTSVTNHANRIIWAAAVFASPETESRRMLWSVLAKNKTATLAQITGASDATVQTAVDGSVDTFALTPPVA